MSRARTCRFWLGDATPRHRALARNGRPPGAENRAKILLGIVRLHWLEELSQGHIEELLDHLIADNSLLRLQGVADQLRGLLCLHDCASIE